MRKFLTAVPNDFWLYVHDSMRNAAPLLRYFRMFIAITRLSDARWRHSLTVPALTATRMAGIAAARAWHFDVSVVD